MPEWGISPKAGFNHCFIPSAWTDSSMHERWRMIIDFFIPHGVLIQTSCKYQTVTPQTVVPVGSPYVSHPGQQCSTSWTNTSHSVQKSFLQSWHRYRSNGLIPSLTFAEGVSSNGRAQAWQVVLVTPSRVVLRQTKMK